MAYSSRLAAALGGVSEHQLSYWRKSSRGKPPLLVPAFGSKPALYSYLDLVTLRMFAQLRESLSLQKVRKAVAYVESQLPKGAHLSAQVIKATPDASAVWVSRDGDYVDVVARPGQPAIKVVMEDIFRSFETASGREVPDLIHPAKGLLIDPEIRGGRPVAEGTRITYDLLAGLRADGLSVAEILDLYPGVSQESVEGAEEFANRVEDSAHAA